MDSDRGKVVIAGGSGFLGLNLAQALADRGYAICIFSRNAPKQAGPWKHCPWDACQLGAWSRELEGATALVNLAGRTVDCVKTPDHCDQILRSRVGSTLLLGKALRKCENPPAIWAQMSTAHIYGDPPDIECSESSPYGYGLAPFVAQAWENAFEDAALPSMRKVILRTSFVLGNSGGALDRLSVLARLGLGGTIGHGKQGMSWLHVQDMNRLFVRAIENDKMQGTYIATAPNPVSNRIFMKQLRKAVGMPVGLPAMEWMVRIAAPLLLRTDPELAIYGRYCVSTRLKEEGYEFTFSELSAALNDIYSN